MNAAQKKIVQYLGEARATEDALVRVLQSQITMTPQGSYRRILEEHLDETRSHAARVADRLQTLNKGGNPVAMVLGFWEDMLGQALALGKMPIDMVRGSGGEEKVLKNAKDACATEALEIATYTALGRLAHAAGDDETAQLAQSILADEERMLERVRGELESLTDAVFGAEVRGDPSFDLSTTGAADAIKRMQGAARDVAEQATGAARDVAGQATGAARDVAGQASGAARQTARQTARTARKAPGAARAEGEVKGAVADAGDLPIAGYEDLTAEEINGKLAGLSQVDLAKIDAYERRHQGRTTVLHRVDALRGDEPWSGYDELTVSEVQSRLSDADDRLRAQVHTYERAHKNRTGVLHATERQTTAG